MNLSDFSLLKEHDDSYHIGSPSGKSIRVPKAGLSDKAQMLISKLKKNQGFSEGTEASPPLNLDEAPNASESLKPSQDTPESIAADAAAQSPEPSAPKMTAEAEQSANPNNQQTAQPVQAAQPSQTPQTGMNPALPVTPEAALQAEKGSLQAGVAAQSQMGKEQSKALENTANAIAALPTANDLIAKHQAADQAYQQALANQAPIDRNRIINNMSTGSKLTSGIAMILGGIGAGLTHQENPALKFMAKAIEDDVESQKNDQSKTMNLWKMNRDALGNDLSANLATENQLASLAKVQLQQAAAKAQGPIAQANAAQAIAGVDQSIATNNWLRSRMEGHNPGTESAHVQDLNTMQQLRPELYKDMQSKYIPGVGTSRVPLTEADRKSLTGFHSLGSAIDDAMNFQKTTAGSLGTFPGSANNASADSKRAAIVLELNTLHGLNRLNDHEFTSYTNSVPSPGSFFSSRSLAKLQELKDQIGRHEQAETTHLGITPFQKAPQDQQAMAWAKANPTDPRAQQILQLNGAH